MRRDPEGEGLQRADAALRAVHRREVPAPARTALRSGAPAGAPEQPAAGARDVVRAAAGASGQRATGDTAASAGGRGRATSDAAASAGGRGGATGDAAAARAGDADRAVTRILANRGVGRTTAAGVRARAAGRARACRELRERAFLRRAARRRAAAQRASGTARAPRRGGTRQPRELGEHQLHRGPRRGR